MRGHVRARPAAVSLSTVADAPAATVARPAPPNDLSPTDRSLGRLAAEVLRMVPTAGVGMVLGFTSVRQADDPVSSAIALARMLARHLNDDVLIVEANLRRPSRLETLLDVPARPGLVDLLAHPDSARHPSGHRAEPGLLAICSGCGSGDRRFLSGTALAQVIDGLRAQMAVTIVVSPPLDEAGDGDVVAARCDRLVAIVQQDATPRQALGAAIDRVGKDRFLGAVVTTVPRRRRWLRRRG